MSDLHITTSSRGRRNDPALARLRREAPSAIRAVAALEAHYRSRRGRHPGRPRVPATTLGDVRELVALWSLELVDWALVGSIDAGDREVLGRWQACATAVVTAPGAAERLYPENPALWACVEDLARQSDDRGMRLADFGELA